MKGERILAAALGYAIAALLALAALAAGDRRGLAASLALAAFHTLLLPCLAEHRWCRWAPYAGFAAALLVLLAAHALGIKPPTLP